MPSSKNYFDKIAARWDGVRQQFFSERVREKALDLAGVHPGQIAADVGAGSGFITEELLAQGLRVIAVDQSQDMLDVIRQKFAESGLVDLRPGEADKLPIDDDSVDFAFANMYLHHVEVPATAISEMSRVLKPGGKLVITDLDEHQHKFLAEEQHDRWLGFKREDVKRWLQAADLRDVRVECLNETCSSDSSEGKETANVSIFVAVGRKARHNL